MNRSFWLITIAALLGITLTISLGVWQLARASQKQAIALSVEANAHLSALDEATLVSLSDPLKALYRPVELHGSWVQGRTVLLDNRQMNARVGFYVVTPLQLAGTRQVVIVQRGWVPRNFEDRAVLPEISTPSGPVHISGHIAPPPAKLYELGNPATGVIRQNLDMAGFAAESGLPLLPVSVQQTGSLSDSLARNWPEAGSGIDRHLGYAFQWFGLSVLIAALYVWFQVVRRFFKRRSTPVAAGPYE